MNPEQKLRKAQLTQRADRAMSDLDSRMRDLLFLDIQNTPSGRAYIFGSGGLPSDSEICGDLWATQSGIDLKDLIAQRDNEAGANVETDRAKRLREIEAMSPQERISAARKEGFE